MYKRHDWRPIQQALRQTIETERPDVLYMDHLDSFVYSHVAPKGTCLALDLHNVYSLIAARTAQESSAMRRVYLNREARLLRKMEAECARRCDVLTAVSTEEAEYFRGLGNAHVHVVPNGVDCQRYAELPVGRKGGVPTILYLGAMSWRPNVAAAQFLAADVLPSVREVVPDAVLRIVGRDPLPEVVALARRPGVSVTGAVDSVVPYLAEAHVLAVPLESGGGTRLKILEAFAAGLPVVSTPVGAEGIDAQPGVHFLQADRPQFARALVAALCDGDTRQRLPSAARQLVLEKYDWRAVGERAIDAILDGLGRRER
jgi:glycosyltransferase involved in cell wall biosynthesis